MNQKLKDLIAQAGTDTSGKWLSLYNAEALAELIIKECASLVVGDPAFILEHFGVEE